MPGKSLNVSPGHSGITKAKTSGRAENGGRDGAEFFEFHGFLDEGFIVYLDPMGKIPTTCP